jgi:ribosomal protein S18 acetylase RimI-like enzyme
VVSVRPYRQSDWQRLCEIHDAARLDELACTTGTEAFKTLEQAFEQDGLFDGRLDVAVVDATVMGFIAYKPGEITWLYVAPKVYRKGVGRALLQHALTRTENPVTLEVLEGNDAALALYKSVGFQLEKRVTGNLSGNESFPATGLILKLDKPYA